jgi:hypothetical protein
VTAPELRYFRVFVKVTNFFLKMDGRLKRLGCYTYRVVRAADPGEAEKDASDLVRGEDWFIENARNVAGEAPRIEVDEVIEVTSSYTIGPLLSWFPDNDVH